MVIAGQSNAAGCGRGSFYDPPELGIHLLRNNGRWDLASHPFNEATGSIHPENLEATNPGHSPYLAFARLVKREVGYPIGLAPTALGGSPLRSWNPEEDGYLYRNMLRTVALAGGRVKGVLWYQGCSDANSADAATYLNRFASMVRHLRHDLDDPELPVLTVQLNRYTGEMPELQEDQAWSALWEAQRRAGEEIPSLYVVPSLTQPGGLAADRYRDISAYAGFLWGTCFMSDTSRRVTVACLGDSMFETMGEECAILKRELQTAYPQVEWVVQNHGVGSTRANYALYRLTHDYEHWGRTVKSLAYQNPDLVLLESFAYNHTLDREEGLKPYQAVMTRIVEHIRLYTGAKILFVRTIPPDHSRFLESVPNFYELPLENRQIIARTVDMYMAEAKEWAEGQGLPCADAYAACLEEIGRGVPHERFVDPGDNIHPSEYGHLAVARCIVEALQREELV